MCGSQESYYPDVTSLCQKSVSALLLYHVHVFLEGYTTSLRALGHAAQSLLKHWALRNSQQCHVKGLLQGALSPLAKCPCFYYGASGQTQDSSTSRTFLLMYSFFLLWFSKPDHSGLEKQYWNLCIEVSMGKQAKKSICRKKPFFIPLETRIWAEKKNTDLHMS